MEIVFAPYCPACLPALHAPLYAAHLDGEFTRAGLDLQILPPVAEADRLHRLRTGAVDLALIDIASIIDAAERERDFGAKCVFVLTQRLPMAAHYVVARETGVAGSAISGVTDLPRLSYGGAAGSHFVTEHRALLRRLFGEEIAPHVDMPYSRMFQALAAGEIDVALDYGGLLPKFQRAVGSDREVAAIRYRDCGVDAYGIGLVASARGLAERGPAISRFLEVAAKAYEDMRVDPESVAARARGALRELDVTHTVAEWNVEEEAMIFGYEAGDNGIGTSQADLWQDTVEWRREVTGVGQGEPSQALLGAVWESSLWPR